MGIFGGSGIFSGGGGGLPLGSSTSGYPSFKAGGTSEIYLDASGVQEFLVRTSGDPIMRQDSYTTQFNGGINHTLLFYEAKMDSGVASGFLFGSGRDANGTSNSVDTFSPSTSINRAHATFRSAFTPSANAPNFAGLQINPTINGTSTGTATALAIASKTNTLTGGTVYLLDVGTTTTDYFTGFTQLGYWKANGDILLGRTTDKIGFYGHAPAARTAGYTITNASADRALNVSADTASQVAAVLGTLIADLQANGLLQ